MEGGKWAVNGSHITHLMPHGCIAVGKGTCAVSKNTDVVIVSAVRTAIGGFGGTLRDVKAHKLAAHVIREVLKRADSFDPNLLSDVIFGEGQDDDHRNEAGAPVLDGRPEYPFDRLLPQAHPPIAPRVSPPGTTSQPTRVKVPGTQTVPRRGLRTLPVR